MNTLTLKNLTREEIAVRFLISTLCILLVVYSFVLLSLIFSAIDKKETGIQVNKLSTLLSTREHDYTEAVMAINESSLKDFGFQKITSSTFAVRKDPVATFTVLYERQ